MFDGLDLEQLDLSQEARQGVVLLLNLLEELKSENEALQQEIQRLRDEINRLKGEQGKPNIKPNKRKDSTESIQEPPAKSDSNEYSSETERQQAALQS